MAGVHLARLSGSSRVVCFGRGRICAFVLCASYPADARCPRSNQGVTTRVMPYVCVAIAWNSALGFPGEGPNDPCADRFEVVSTSVAAWRSFESAVANGDTGSPQICLAQETRVLPAARQNIGRFSRTRAFVARIGLARLTSHKRPSGGTAVLWPESWTRSGGSCANHAVVDARLRLNGIRYTFASIRGATGTMLRLGRFSRISRGLRAGQIRC